MDTRKVLFELRAERASIDRAIKAIESLGSAGRKVGRRAVSATPHRRRRLSAAARRRLSELMKKRWASGKMGKRKA